MKPFEQRESGLVVPREKPKAPKRKYGRLEIQDEEKRELAAEALSKLWDAMELSKGVGGIIDSPNENTREAWMQLYEYAGNMLLGEDKPVKEVLC